MVQGIKASPLALRRGGEQRDVLLAEAFKIGSELINASSLATKVRGGMQKWCSIGNSSSVRKSNNMNSVWLLSVWHRNIDKITGVSEKKPLE